MPDRRRPRPSAAILLGAAILLAACSGGGTPVPTQLALPSPTCGGVKVAITGALSCERIASLAIEALRARAPEQLARGVTAIDVQLAGCPTGEVPQQIDCTGVQFAQLVTVEFGPAPAAGPIEPSLTVALDPVSGRLLGIANPLIQ